MEGEEAGLCLGGWIEWELNVGSDTYGSKYIKVQGDSPKLVDKETLLFSKFSTWWARFYTQYRQFPEVFLGTKEKSYSFLFFIYEPLRGSLHYELVPLTCADCFR